MGTWPADVLLVSKPLGPPWNDSGKVLPFLLAKNLKEVRLAVLTAKGQSLGLPGVIEEQIYSESKSFSVALTEKARLFFWLARANLPPVLHFFFSPNLSTALAARLLRRLRSGIVTVQTLMSLPDDTRRLGLSLFADVVVVWSAYALEVAKEAAARKGFRGKIVHINPGISPLSPASAEERAAIRKELGLPVEKPVILYAGDLEFTSAAQTVAGAAKLVLQEMQAVFIFACRAKTKHTGRYVEALRAGLKDYVSRGEIRFFQKTDFHALLRCVDVQVFPAESTFAKTDIPLVLLEGLSAGVPAVVATNTPMQELVLQGAATGVPPMDPQALAHRLITLFSRPGQAEALGRAGRAVVMARYTAEAMAKAHATLYRQLLQAARYFVGQVGRGHGKD